MRSLIEIAQDSSALEELLQSTDGELTPTLEDFLDEINTNLTTKVDNYSHMMDHLENTASLYRIRSENYRLAAKSAENVVERMKQRIEMTMILMNKNELEGNDIRFKLQNSPASLEITDPKLIPSEMQIVTTTTDNKRIKAALMLGAEIPGAKLKQSKYLRSYLKK